MQIRSSDPVLAVHDLDGEADWFMRVLGCSRFEPDPGNWVFCSAGTVTFMLGRCPDALKATDLGDHSYFTCLTVDCLDDYHARAIAEGAEILKPPTDEPWGRREMTLSTTEGFRLMLSERTGRDDAESSTSSGQLLRRALNHAARRAGWSASA